MDKETIENSKCKYCGEDAEDCNCQKLRLLLRTPIADSEGRLAEYVYKTQIVFVPFDDEMIRATKGKGNYEVIGGEWLTKENPNE